MKSPAFARMVSMRAGAGTAVLLTAGALAGCSSAEAPAAAPCAEETHCTEAGAPDRAGGARTGDGSTDDPGGGDDSSSPEAGAPVSTTPDGGRTSNDGATTPPRDGGRTAPAGEVKPSAGCGSAAPAGGGKTIDVTGTSREYILTLPRTYDKAKAYRLVFAWHGLGGSAAQVARDFYGLLPQGNESTIFVAGQGLQTSNSVGTGAGWANTNGEDVAFVRALYALLQSQVCFDENRVFSVGMSYGGIMSNTLGCQMGDVFRAIAPMSGAGPGYGGRGASCVGQVAVWSSHGNSDTTVPTAQGEASRDFWVKANHCQSTSKAVDPAPCLAYDGCDPNYPVTFCEFAGGHTIPSFASKAIWSFFSQF